MADWDHERGLYSKEAGAQENPFDLKGHDGQPISGRIESSSIESEDTHLHRGLSAPMVAMIAIGGALGTGLIIGTGQALVTGG